MLAARDGKKGTIIHLLQQISPSLARKQLPDATPQTHRRARKGPVCVIPILPSGGRAGAPAVRPAPRC